MLDYAEVAEYSRQVLQTSLNEWLQDWLTLYKVDKVRPATLRKAQGCIDNYIISDIGKMPLSDISGQDLQRFLIRIKAPRQREHLFGLLRDAFTRAYSLQLITFNSIVAVSIPKHHKKKW